MQLQAREPTDFTRLSSLYTAPSKTLIVDAAQVYHPVTVNLHVHVKQEAKFPAVLTSLTLYSEGKHNSIAGDYLVKFS